MSERGPMPERSDHWIPWFLENYPEFLEPRDRGYRPSIDWRTVRIFLSKYGKWSGARTAQEDIPIIVRMTEEHPEDWAAIKARYRITGRGR